MANILPESSQFMSCLELWQSVISCHNVKFPVEWSSSLTCSPISKPGLFMMVNYISKSLSNCHPRTENSSLHSIFFRMLYCKIAMPLYL